ncbi:MAG: AI-2E family transporter [Verrucomicrobia bacterium]|nr:AI-2E family transporter [Verrucomicrobiota bacterium]
MAEGSPTPLFTSAQRRVLAAALVLLGGAAAVATVIAGLFLLGWLGGYFAGVLWPLAVAGVLALILRPIVALFEVRLRLSRLAAVTLLFGIFLLGAAGLLVLAVPPVVDQILDFIAYAPTLWTNAQAYFHQHYPQWVALVDRQLANPVVRQVADHLGEELRTMLTHTLPSLKAAGGGLLGLVAFATHLAIVPVYLFFFLLARGGSVEALRPHLPFLKKETQDDALFLLREFVGIVESFFRGQLVIGLIMGVLLATGFSLIGLRFGLLVGLVAGILNIVPYLGTIIGLGVAVPLALLQSDGGWRLVLLVLLVKLVVQLVEGWLLTPKIMGERTGLHPVTIIVAIFFWGTAFHGVLGMLFAIPLTAFVVTAWRLVKHKYFGAAAG